MAGLPWIRLDTNMPTNEKIIHLAGLGDRGLAAAFVYVASLAHAGGHDTSGFIARDALPFVHGKRSHARILVDSGLWDEVENGWQIRNWGERNVVAAAQQALSHIRSDAGKKGAAARWGDGKDPLPDANAVANGKTMASDGTYVRTNERTNERPPRHTEISPVPERARGNRDEARREIDELTHRRRG